MLMRRGIRSASLMLVMLFVLVPRPASATPAYYLPPGTHLTVGQCITSTSNFGTAKLCMAHYGNVNTYFKGALVDQWGADSRTNSAPSAYLVTTASGYIRIYQYAGGPLIWHYDGFHSWGFTNLGIEISSFTLGAGWCTYVTDLNSYKWPWRGPNCASP